MVLYITRNSAGQIISMGLNGLSVWVEKPTRMVNLSASDLTSRYFMFNEKDQTDPTMKGYQDFPDYLLESGYWAIQHASSSKATHSTPFGDMFGYCDSEDEFSNSIANDVWKEVNKEFNNEPFDYWEKIDRDNKSINGSDKFMMKLTIGFNGYSLENISGDHTFEYDTNSQHNKKYYPF